eukprot:CAMPEP_0168336966 /NCGR_PEP_ID=MMETSP0213-20121227/11876_1 /TAXON_ID=151035 /ORGANISM="Euplotes harpa, Strain FSP1.4" /LENGTH=58 /DNA_ID=CAMNT_0008342299 /DNA_START=157 /DNA_END=333 /DNA_ORIENTATION=+
MEDELVAREERRVIEYLLMRQALVREEDVLKANGVDLDTDSQDMIRKIARRVGLEVTD